MDLRSFTRKTLVDFLGLTVLLIASPWLVWRFVVQKKNRRGGSQKLFGTAPKNKVAGSKNSGPRIWLQAVSVGEVHLLVPIVKELQSAYPDAQFFLSTSTETGFDRARELFADEHEVFFWPWDFSWAINCVMRRISPDLVLLIELELWPNFVHIASERSVPVAVVNGRLSESSARGYARFGWLLQSTFESLSLVAAQNETYASRFLSLGCRKDRVHVSGNIKYDGVETNRENPKTRRVREIASRCGLTPQHKIFLAGSTQIEDETAAVDAYLKIGQAFENLRLVIVPRHPSRIKEIEHLVRDRGLTAVFRSALQPRSESELKPESKLDPLPTGDAKSVIVVDVIGELSGWWGLADVAFVGGSMGSRGGQNMIEPAALGVPVCFGPNTRNFRSTVEGLLAENAAVVVSDSDQLASFLQQMLSQDTIAVELGSRAQHHVVRNQGAVAKTVRLLDELLPTVTPAKNIEDAA